MFIYTDTHSVIAKIEEQNKELGINVVLFTHILISVNMLEWLHVWRANIERALHSRKYKFSFWEESA